MTDSTRSSTRDRPVVMIECDICHRDVQRIHPGKDGRIALSLGVASARPGPRRPGTRRRAELPRWPGATLADAYNAMTGADKTTPGAAARDTSAPGDGPRTRFTLECTGRKHRRIVRVFTGPLFEVAYEKAVAAGRRRIGMLEV